MADIIYYFNGAVDNDWNELGNWWMDSTYTTPAENLPSSEDTAYIYATVNSNSGDPISVLSISIYDCVLAVPVTVSEGLSANLESGLLNTITGNVSLLDSSYNEGTIAGDATFYSTSYNSTAGIVENNAIFNDSSYNNGTINGNATFNNSSYNNSIVYGIGTFYNSSYNQTDGTLQFDVTFNDSSYNSGYIGDGEGGTVIFNNTSQNYGAINYPTTFNDRSINSDDGGSINNNTTFNNYSENAGYTYGDNTYFNDNSTNSGTVTGDAIVIYPHATPFDSSNGNTGSITGSIYYSNYPTLYYNNATTDGNWNNRLNWWIDSGYSQQANEVPSSSQDVIIDQNIYGTTSTLYCNNATINAEFAVNTVITLYVTSKITISNGYIGTNMFSGPNIECVDAEFQNDSFIIGNNTLTASGTVTFKGTSSLGSNGIYSGAGYIIGNVVFEDNSDFYSGTITGNASFYNNSTFSGGIVTLDVTVYYDHSLPFTYGGTINGSLLYSGYPSRTVYYYHTDINGQDWGGNFWYTATAGGGSSTYAPDPNISLDHVIIEAYVGTNTGNLDTTVATLTVNDVATPVIFVAIDITCNYANFNDSSYLYAGATLTQSANHGGNSITFSDLSHNEGTINPDTPPVIFEDSSYNDGTINGDVDVYYPSENPIGGIVTGFITYYGYGSLYFGMTTDGDWSNPNNWYFDAANTLPFNDVPPDIMPYRSVIIQSNVTSSPLVSAAAYDLNTYGSYPYIENVNITVSNLATFSEETYLGTGAIITGNALFENLATNRSGTITGIATFTLSSAETMINNGYDGTYGDIEFQYGKGINGSSILGIV